MSKTEKELFLAYNILDVLLVKEIEEKIHIKPQTDWFERWVLTYIYGLGLGLCIGMLGILRESEVITDIGMWFSGGIALVCLVGTYFTRKTKRG